MQPRFITHEHITAISSHYQTPCYIYHEQSLIDQAQAALAFPHAYGLTVRYAMKANPNANILRIFDHQGIHIDASSGFEVQRALAAGIPGSHIQLSGQELPTDFSLVIDNNISFVATSLHQLATYGQHAPGTSCGVRINPGVGSGAFKKIDTGGPTSSFGIRHEYIDRIHQVAAQYDITITKIHIHIGSENTPDARADAASQAIDLVRQFPGVTTLNMGGGFKIAIMPYEHTADLQSIGTAVQQQLQSFAAETGRQLHLEIEPGKFLVMNTCSLIAQVTDIVDTGPAGYHFIKTNTGMTELPRISMYGIQQPIYIIPQSLPQAGDIERSTPDEFVIVGHCCESGDLLTCMLYQSETVEPITLPTPNIGDYLIVQSCGAYNAGMAMKHYNSFPEAAELLIRTNGDITCIRKRQKLTQVWSNEVVVV